MMKLFQARETISENLAEHSNIVNEIFRVLEKKVIDDALNYIGTHDQETLDNLKNNIDVDTEYLERGKSWRFIVTCAVIEKKPLFQKPSGQLFKGKLTKDVL